MVSLSSLNNCSAWVSCASSSISFLTTKMTKKNPLCSCALHGYGCLLLSGNVFAVLVLTAACSKLNNGDDFLNGSSLLYKYIKFPFNENLGDVIILQ